MSKRYGTDPWTVAHWEPERLILAASALVAHDMKVARLVRRAGSRGAPVFVVLDLDDVASMPG